jgi:SusD family.
MKNNIFISILLLSTTLFWSCNDNSFLDVKSTNILTSDEVFSDPTTVTTVLADLYDRMPNFGDLDNNNNFCYLDNAFNSSPGSYWLFQFQNYDYNFYNADWGGTYTYIRELNLFKERIKAATKLQDKDKAQFLSEDRFLLAWTYFDMVKRYGGVPLVLNSLSYNYSGNATYLQYPRAKESQIYDFVIGQCDSISESLPDNPSIKSRITKAAALALEARAAIYAASIAKYNALRTPTEHCTPNNDEVGMTDATARANDYYTIALNAAKKIITSGGYSLYMKKATDLQDNFASLFTDKNNNPEVIFVRDYELKYKTHGFTINNQPYSQTEDLDGGSLNPSLNLAQSFEKLDNTFAPFDIVDAGNTPKLFADPQTLFANRDARLGGTIILPGTSFKGKKVDIWAGLKMTDGTIKSADIDYPFQTINGVYTQVVGKDGPVDLREHTAQTGFLVRKYLDPTVGSGKRGTRSDTWWVRFRYAEILLIAAEASFELGDNASAATYINQVRARAGFTIPLAPADITFDRIVHENRVEFAFEDHYLWDMKRWRLAHVVWNGTNISKVGAPGNIEAPSTKIFGLWPYKISNPGQPDDGQFYFVEKTLSAVTNAHNFQLGNYYAKVADDVIARNPKLTKNPNQ